MRGAKGALAASRPRAQHTGVMAGREMTTMGPQGEAGGRAHYGRGLALRNLMLAGLAALLAAACTPTVKLQAPDEPITINLNIQADVRVRIEEAAQQDIESNPDIFGE